MLQSEYDAGMRQKRLKVLLIVLTTLMVALVLYAALKVGREKMSVQEPVMMAPKNGMDTPPPSPEEIQKKLEELSKTSDGKALPPPSPEEIQKRLDELSKKPDGTTPPPPSQEEIMKRLNELSAKK